MNSAMRTDALLAEFTAATVAAKRQAFDYLVAQGVPPNWLWGGPMRFGVVEIITDRRTYQPMRGGRRALVVPAIPLRVGFFDDDIGDLIAWLPDNPGRWWHRAGVANFLNFEAVERADFFEEPLSLWATPLSWLQAGGEGAVVLDERAHLPLWFGGITKIDCESLELARQIKRRITAQEQRLPKIYVRTNEEEAAA
jgi:hypothetical protein